MSKYSKPNSYKTIKLVRDALGLTLDDVHQMTGISAGYINRIEKGLVDVSSDRVRDALDLFLEGTIKQAQKIIKLREANVLQKQD